MRISFLRLPHAAGLPLPSRQTADAAGLDLMAALGEPLTLAPLGRVLVPTGFSLAIPSGYEGQVRPRSGLAVRHGVTVLNAPGTIDADYRGELQVALMNLGSEPFEIRHGMRIAQLVIAPVIAAEPVEVGALDTTLRGEGGFGSTGLGSTGLDSTDLDSRDLGLTGLGSTGFGGTDGPQGG